MGRARLFTWIAAALSVCPAAAYYHYIHYTSLTAPYAPIAEKFDLRALPNNTVTFFASEQGPTQYLTGDSFNSVLSQIQEATRAWNSIATSELRVRFGGLYSPGTPQSAPGGEVVFDELPPGVLGLGGPTARAGVATGPNGPFVPITRAVVRLSRDLTQRPGPAHSEVFFLTVLHEMGHALGLQHTLTSSAMSTDVTRAVSRAKPLDDDDIAALSLLYPTQEFSARFGTITGRVTFGEDGVHLASVVAIRQGGSVVSALTTPDGVYRIEGVPPGQYLIYAHPLPPATQSDFGPANVVLPRDADDQPVPAGDAFGAVFYPGTRDPLNVTPVSVASGTVAENINFSVERRAHAAVYGVTTYSFFDQTAVKPAYLNTGPGMGTVVAYGAGLTSGGDVAPGLGVSTLDGTAVFSPASFRTYGDPYVFLAFDLLFNFASGTGSRHLVFSNSTDMYVLPSAVHLVQEPPPSITSVEGGVSDKDEHFVRLSGAGLTPTTEFYFDGAPSAVRTFDAAARQAVVIPPPAPAGHKATILAVNPDGQTSMFVQAQDPPTYTYDFGGQPSVTLSPFNLRSGSEGLVEISGVNTNFVQGATVVGFGTSDIVVRRVFVMSPTYALANVAVMPGVEPVWTTASVITGLQVSAIPYGFLVTSPNPALPAPSSQVVNAATGQTRIWPGSTAQLNGLSLTALGASPPFITLRNMATGTDVPLNILSAVPEQISFEIPAGFPLGATILKLSSGSETVASVAILIETPPPVVAALVNGANEVVDSGHAAHRGETLTIRLASAGEPGEDIAVSRLRVNIGGLSQSIQKAGWSPEAPEVFLIRVLLSTDTPTGTQVPVTVTLDGQTTQPFQIAVE